MEIYVAGERSIKVWDARSGKPVRSLKNVMASDITCMELDNEHRKLIVGSQYGDVKVFDIVSGRQTLSLDSHDPQEGEISYVGYGGDDNTIITCGWDRVIKVHKDEVFDYSMTEEDGTQDQSAQGKKDAQPDSAEKRAKRRVTDKQDPRWPYGNMQQPIMNLKDSVKMGEEDQKQKTPRAVNTTSKKQGNEDNRFRNMDNLLRGRTDSHTKDIICADLAMHLDLIATGGRDNRVRIWDYERIQPAMDELPDSGPCYAHTADVTLVRFIKPFPLLITTDTSGQLYVWLTAPHPDKGECIISWRNAFTLKTNCPITALDTHYDPETGEFILLVGDELGNIRVQDVSAILKQKKTRPILPENTSEKKRNPYR